MGKILNKYRGYTPAAMKARADIPSAGDIVVNANDIDCSNISLNAVAALLGFTDNPIPLVEICQHDNINRWSGFSPIQRSVVAQALVNSVPNVCRLGDFAGYNHGAVTPGWKNAPITTDLWVNNGGQAEIFVDVTVGEVKWHEVANGIVGVVFALYDGGALVAYVARNFNDANVTDDATGLYAYINNCATEKTYTGKVWLVDSTDFGPEGFDGSQIVCRLPNTADFNRTVKIKAASTAVFESTGTNQPPSPWVNNNGGLGMNWTTGILTIGYDIEANQSWSNVRVYAVLRNWLDEVIGQADIFNGAYNALDSVYGSVYLGMDNIPAYGYSVKVYFEYTI